MEFFGCLTVADGRQSCLTVSPALFLQMIQNGSYSFSDPSRVIFMHCFGVFMSFTASSSFQNRNVSIFSLRAPFQTGKKSKNPIFAPPFLKEERPAYVDYELWCRLFFSLSRLSLSGSSRGIKGRAMCRPLAHTQCHWPDSSPSVSHDQSSTGPYVFFIAAVSTRGGLAERERVRRRGDSGGWIP